MHSLAKERCARRPDLESRPQPFPTELCLRARETENRSQDSSIIPLSSMSIYGLENSSAATHDWNRAPRQRTDLADGHFDGRLYPIEALRSVQYLHTWQ